MREKIRDHGMVIAGTTMTALAFGLLILPMGILAGGVTGCARLISAWCDLPVSGIVLIINTALFIAGYLCMGRVFIMRSVVSTFYFPMALELMRRLPALQITSIPAAAVVAGALLGVGGALVILGNGSQGGFDIIAIILNKKWNIPIAVVINGIDAILILLQVSHATAAQVLGALLLVAACGITMNFLIVRCEAKHLTKNGLKRVYAYKRWWRWFAHQNLFPRRCLALQA